MQDTQYILSINAGSSSTKFSLYLCENLSLIAKGKVDHIGMEHTTLLCEDLRTHEKTEIKIDPDKDSLEIVTDTLSNIIGSGTIVCIGHRFVHGGVTYRTPTSIDATVIATLHTLTPLAPRHIPAQLAVLERLHALYPNIPHIACFDTAFFKDLPRMAQIIALPYQYEKVGVRRYGFHGLSYEYIVHTLTHTLKVPLTDKKVIVAHLGSGASLTALVNGVPVETSMGFSPTSGISMGTRSGELDPGLFEFFTNNAHLTPEQFNHMVNYESGSLGISGTTSDMEMLIQNEDRDVRAKEAVNYFAYTARKMIGSLTAVMGGLDMLVFTGGIGERSSAMRRYICNGLEYLGVSLNVITNIAQQTVVSNEGSQVILYVVPTDEEYIIARHASEFLTLITKNNQ